MFLRATGWQEIENIKGKCDGCKHFKMLYMGWSALDMYYEPACMKDRYRSFLTKFNREHGCEEFIANEEVK